MAKKSRHNQTVSRKSAEQKKHSTRKSKEKRKANDHASKELVVVGIGASAGGLEAFQQLLKNLSFDTGKAFVLIQHLDPTHKSSLVEILARSTRMPVQEAEGNALLQPNRIYVIPPNSYMTVSEGRLQLTSRNKIRGSPPYPIDRFLESLAQEFKERAIGVILSGTAFDGTRGLKAIKTYGGITFAQDEKSARYPDMPRNAGVIADFILPPERLAQELGKSIHPLYPASVQEKKRPKAPKQQFPIEEIYSILRESSGVDLSNYRSPTLERRIQRRMTLMKQQSLKDYAAYLRNTSSEPQALYRDIFIHVTNFFREPEKYDRLKTEIYPRILKAKSKREPIRVWVVGCSSGEEVYSLAITLMEFLGEQGSAALPQIFGSDIDPEIVEFARRGIYPRSIEQDVSAKRLKKFFTKTDQHYQINKNVRELCVFAKHDIIGDPAFSRIDLISCCNVLIYFTRDSQANLFKTFQYALKPSGYLILGKSEAVPLRSSLFERIDKKHRIYIRKQGAQPEVPTFSKRATPHAVPEYEKNEKPALVFDLQKAADHLALQEYGHRGLVVDSNQNILHFRGDVSPFLKPSSGEASLTLSKILREEVWLPLRGMIEASKKRQTRQQKEITATIGHSLSDLVLEVIPFMHPNSGERFFLILLKDTTSGKTQKRPSERKRGKDKKGSRDRYVLSLEQELTDIREYMRSSAQEQETVNSQLNFANEELQSTNEELQSLNEELETSKEELESGNEELNALNEELRNRNVELTNLNFKIRKLSELNDAILKTMREPFLILDSDLMIKSVSQSFYHTFKTTKSETKNRHLYDLGNKQWDRPELRTAVEEVLSKRSDLRDYEVESDFPIIGHRIMSLNGSRILQKEGKEELILLSIEDITDRKELDLQIRIKEIHHRVKNNLQVIASLLNIQSYSENNPEIKSALRESQNRIKSMALIHERLYASNQEGRIVFKEYVSDLLANIFRSLGLDRAKISTKVDVRDIFLDIDVAVPCALILNELVTNSALHAFSRRNGGQIRIEMKPEIQNDGGTVFKFVVSDNGAGLPAEIIPEHAESMGLKIVWLLTRQIGGTLTVDRKKGTTFRIEFPA